MPKYFNDKVADYCFDNCPRMELEVNTTHTYADNRPRMTCTVISCVHEKACQMWANYITDQESQKKPSL